MKRGGHSGALTLTKVLVITPERGGRAGLQAGRCTAVSAGSCLPRLLQERLYKVTGRKQHLNRKNEACVLGDPSSSLPFPHSRAVSLPPLGEATYCPQVHPPPSRDICSSHLYHGSMETSACPECIHVSLSLFPEQHNGTLHSGQHIALVYQTGGTWVTRRDLSGSWDLWDPTAHPLRTPAGWHRHLPHRMGCAESHMDCAGSPSPSPSTSPGSILWLHSESSSYILFFFLVFVHSTAHDDSFHRGELVHVQTTLHSVRPLSLPPWSLPISSRSSQGSPAAEHQPSQKPRDNPQCTPRPHISATARARSSETGNSGL